VVSFTPLDVCFAIRLRIVGEKVSFTSVKSEESSFRKIFEGESITILTIVAKVEKLSGDKHVVDFCRLYILLGFAEFYLPSTYGSVHGGMLSYLDHLDSIGKYSWGVMKYGDLISSLHRAQKSL
jgi:hypothetical protein